MKLTDIPLHKLDRSAYTALSRLHVWLTGQTHGLLATLSQRLQTELAHRADTEGQLSPTNQAQLQATMSHHWQQTFSQWQRLFQFSRRQAVLLSFGPLARRHQRYTELQESNSGVDVDFQPQIQQILDQTAERIYGDGFKLSQRIWNLNQTSQQGLKAVIVSGVATGESAWEMAQKLEKFLGPGQDCPRWAKQRLRVLTKADIAKGDTTGLIRGNPCGSQGVAYNALRLARNEINIAHHTMTDALFKVQPWIDKERIRLSPAHPKTDVCDTVVTGGEKGRGIYPVGTYQLPLHVHCLCYKTAVMLTQPQFKQRVQAWQAGQAWPKMDRYSRWTGLPVGQLLPSFSAKTVALMAGPLLLWLASSSAKLDKEFEQNDE